MMSENAESTRRISSVRNCIANSTLRRPQIRQGTTVARYTELERKPAVVVYCEVNMLTTMVPQYVYLSGSDIRKESRLIHESPDPNRSEKFYYYNSWKTSFEPHYLHRIGSPDHTVWSVEEAVINLDGFARLREKEDELIREHKPKRQCRSGGAGRTPGWVKYWLNRLGFRNFRDFNDIR